jgi:hypothetical protein
MEYLETEGLEKCLPGIPDIEHGLSVYFKYFTKEEEAEFGVVAIKLELINQTGGNDVDTFKKQIDELGDKDVFVEETINGNSEKPHNLIIIPGFSEQAYTNNKSTLFEWYDTKLDKDLFNELSLIKFSPQVKKLSQDIFQEGKIIDESLENYLYKKCAEIIYNNVVRNNKKYIILGKSAGGGVSLYLAQKLKTPKQLSHLFLFAPGIKYIGSDKGLKIGKKLKIYVGWNNDDKKVKHLEHLPVLQSKVQITDNSIYEKLDSPISEGIDTQHEINTKFIEKVNKVLRA